MIESPKSGDSAINALAYGSTTAGLLTARGLKRRFASNASANSLKSFLGTLPRYKSMGISVATDHRPLELQCTLKA
jgi:hypothetical protein